jgi:hypothetical protein
MQEQLLFVDLVTLECFPAKAPRWALHVSPRLLLADATRGDGLSHTAPHSLCLFWPEDSAANAITVGDGINVEKYGRFSLAGGFSAL